MSWWLSADHRLDVVLDRRDAADAKVLDENLGDIRGEESRQRRSEVDVLDAEVQQGQQDDDGLLLVPSDVEDKRQLVDVIKTEDFLELERDQREAVGVVALASIEDARDAADVAEVHLDVLVLRAASRQDDRILRLRSS